MHSSSPGNGSSPSSRHLDTALGLHQVSVSSAFHANGHGHAQRSHSVAGGLVDLGQLQSIPNSFTGSTTSFDGIAASIMSDDGRWHARADSVLTEGDDIELLADRAGDPDAPSSTFTASSGGTILAAFQEALVIEVERVLRTAAMATPAERTALLQDLLSNIAAPLEDSVLARLREAAPQIVPPPFYFQLLAEAYTTKPAALVRLRPTWSRLWSHPTFQAIFALLYYLALLAGWEDPLSDCSPAFYAAVLSTLAAGVERVAWSDVQRHTLQFMAVHRAVCTALSHPTKFRGTAPDLVQSLCSVCFKFFLYYAGRSPAQELHQWLLQLPDYVHAALDGSGNVSQPSPSTALSAAGLATMGSQPIPPLELSMTRHSMSTPSGAAAKPTYRDVLRGHSEPTTPSRDWGLPEGASSVGLPLTPAECTTPPSDHSPQPRRHNWDRSASVTLDDLPPIVAPNPMNLHRNIRIMSDESGGAQVHPLPPPSPALMSMSAGSGPLGSHAPSWGSPTASEHSSLRQASSGRLTPPAACSPALASPTVRAISGALLSSSSEYPYEDKGVNRLRTKFNAFVLELAGMLQNVRHEDSLVQLLQRVQGLALPELREELSVTTGARLRADLNKFATRGGPLFPTRAVREAASGAIDALWPGGAWVRQLTTSTLRVLSPYYLVRTCARRSSKAVLWSFNATVYVWTTPVRVALAVLGCSRRGQPASQQAQLHSPEKDKEE